MALLSDARGDDRSPQSEITLDRDRNWLVIREPGLPGGEIRINYLEAYCRAGSAEADWVAHTVIKHASELVELRPDHRRLRLRDTLADGVTVDHTITAQDGAVRFELVAHNPTAVRSEAEWAQPCIRLGAFTGFPDSPKDSPTDYLSKCFLFLNGRLTRMPTPQWATQARYTPGQVWRPASVPVSDVNPRPLNPLIPDNGLIGCYSADEKRIFVTAWEPYQELFQGVARCLHSDFRIGGLEPGETKRIRGCVYLAPNNIDALMERYRKDFPEHFHVHVPQ